MKHTTLAGTVIEIPDSHIPMLKSVYEITTGCYKRYSKAKRLGATAKQYRHYYSGFNINRSKIIQDLMDNLSNSFPEESNFTVSMGMATSFTVGLTLIIYMDSDNGLYEYRLSDVSNVLMCRHRGTSQILDTSTL